MHIPLTEVGADLDIVQEGFPKCWNPLTAFGKLWRGFPRGLQGVQEVSVSLGYISVLSKGFLFKFKNNVNISSKY